MRRPAASETSEQRLPDDGGAEQQILEQGAAQNLIPELAPAAFESTSLVVRRTRQGRE